ncbi:MAG: hypothetical protein ACUVQ3_09560, partial [bacterium]
MEKKCKCPFCDSELLFKCFEPIFCTTCQIELVVCSECGKLYNIKFEKCPHCGTKNEINKR